MTYRCPYPGCNGIDFIEMRPLYRFARGWFGVRRQRSGSQVMCTACLGHSSATPEGLEMMLRPKGNPQQEEAAPMATNGSARRGARFADLGQEP